MVGDQSHPYREAVLGCPRVGEGGEGWGLAVAVVVLHQLHLQSSPVVVVVVGMVVVVLVMVVVKHDTTLNTVQMGLAEL